MWSKDIVNSVFIKGVQDSDNDETLTPVEFKMEQDKILRIIKKYNNRHYILSHENKKP